ncbi:S-layer homology domain-containing protein [Agathobaculum sp.]|uniref:S-layer homology domain-containing protein n=1 Tax=Agathobaculum sp. TaxID=2048138 RepID=UPI0039A2F237
MFAGAAFTDQSDIAVDSDVVDTMTALGVIEGYLDGSFRPDDTVTRGEMAKMIYVVRTGRSDASAYNDDATTFTDIGDHWARGYIKYCNSLGIIAGHSATRFAPDDTVTTQEAAKMLLVTLGYNAETAGLVGAGWGTKTNALADENGLLEDVVNGTTQALPRQYAAQLIYNAIFTPTVRLRDGQYTNMNDDGDLYPTIGERYMGLKSVEGKLAGYTDGKANFEDIDWGTNKEVSFADYTADHSDLVGREVRILYKESTNSNTKATIYGIFEIGDNTYIDTIVGEVTDYSAADDEIDINGTTYDVADNALFSTWDDKNSAQPITVTLNDDDEVYALDKDANFNFAQVTYIGSKSINTDLTKNDTFKSTSFDVEDVEAYDDLAEDDYVVISKNDYTGKWVLTKADVITGEIEVVNGEDITIDGETYTKADDDFQKTLSDLDLGNTVEIVVVDGYIYSAEKVSGIASLEDVLYVNGMEKSTSYGETTYTAQAIFTDGTSEPVEVADITGDDKWQNEIESTGNAEAVKAAAHSKDGLYVFDLDDGEYTLRPVNYDNGTTKIEDFEDEDLNIATAGDDRIGNFRVNDEAVVFVKDSDGDVHVLSGADVKAWDKDNVDVTAGKAYGDKSNGFTYVDLAELTIADDDVPGSSYDETYGYVVNTLGQTKEDNTTYTSFSVWTGSEAETIRVKGDAKDFTDIVKGTFVKIDGDDIIKLVDKTNDAYLGAVEGTDGESFTVRNGNGDEYKIVDDTQVIYVDTDAIEGAEGGSIREATNHNDSSVYENNVFFVVDKNSKDGNTFELVAVFVDVNNELVTK